MPQHFFDNPRFVGMAFSAGIEETQPEVYSQEICQLSCLHSVTCDFAVYYPSVVECSLANLNLLKSGVESPLDSSDAILSFKRSIFF